MSIAKKIPLENLTSSRARTGLSGSSGANGRIEVGRDDQSQDPSACAC